LSGSNLIAAMLLVVGTRAVTYRTGRTMIAMRSSRSLSSPRMSPSGYSSGVDEDKPSEPVIDLAERRREERRAVDEAGGGESEGFELAEQDLIEHASHGDQQTPARIMQDAGPDEESAGSVYGEADDEHHTD
jgi:hypothetical protein